MLSTSEDDQSLSPSKLRALNICDSNGSLTPILMIV